MSPVGTAQSHLVNDPGTQRSQTDYQKARHCGVLYASCAPERADVHLPSSIEKCVDEGTWALLTSQIKPEALSAIGEGEPVAWDVFWPQVRARVA